MFLNNYLLCIVFLGLLPCAPLCAADGKALESRWLAVPGAHHARDVNRGEGRAMRDMSASSDGEQAEDVARTKLKKNLCTFVNLMYGKRVRGDTQARASLKLPNVLISEVLGYLCYKNMSARALNVKKAHELRRFSSINGDEELVISGNNWGEGFIDFFDPLSGEKRGSCKLPRSIGVGCDDNQRKDILLSPKNLLVTYSALRVRTESGAWPFGSDSSYLIHRTTGAAKLLAIVLAGDAVRMRDGSIVSRVYDSARFVDDDPPVKPELVRIKPTGKWRKVIDNAPGAFGLMPDNTIVVAQIDAPSSADAARGITFKCFNSTTGEQVRHVTIAAHDVHGTDLLDLAVLHENSIVTRHGVPQPARFEAMVIIWDLARKAIIKQRRYDDCYGLIPLTRRLFTLYNDEAEGGHAQEIISGDTGEIVQCIPMNQKYQTSFKALLADGSMAATSCDGDVTIYELLPMLMQDLVDTECKECA